MFQLHVGVSDVIWGQKIWYHTISTWVLTARLSTLLFVNFNNFVTWFHALVMIFVTSTILEVRTALQ